LTAATLSAGGHPTILGGVLVALVSAGVAALGAGAAAAAGPVDRPRSRSAHASPTPTSGGLGIILGCSAGLLLIPFLCATRSPETLRIAAAFAISAGLGILGAVDDLFDLGARLKLLVQTVLALLFAVCVARVEVIPTAPGAGLVLGYAVGVLGTALWLVVVGNAVNFMDGANGLASGSVGLVLLALSACALARGDGVLGLSALACAAAQAGFLPWNAPRARVFQGDAGALFSSVFLASLAVIGAGRSGDGAAPLYLAPLALAPLLTDVLLTLLERALGRAPLLEAHADHLYQRWLAGAGASHGALAVRVWGLVAAFALAATLLALFAPLGVQAAGLMGGVALAALGWRRLRRRFPRILKARADGAAADGAGRAAAD